MVVARTIFFDAEEMSANSDLDERPGTPDELIDMADSATKDLLPSKSKVRYEQTLREFKKWQVAKDATSNSERVVLSYFSDLKNRKLSPGTLWSRYSMLKSTLKIYESVDISTYASLMAFLKKQLKGYIPKKAKVLTEVELRRFIEDAPDVAWLDVKVVCILAIFGCCRSHEFASLLTTDITRYPDMYYFDIKETKTLQPNGFAVIEPLLSVVKQYVNLRPKNGTSSRFFLNYQTGKCSVQVIGKNKFYKMPRRIAEFLGLEEVDLYTGHSFRRSSTTLYANTGASIEAVKRHTGHSSSKICEAYIEDSIENKRKRSNEIMSALNRASTSTSRIAKSSEASTDSGRSTSTFSVGSGPVGNRDSVTIPMNPSGCFSAGADTGCNSCCALNDRHFVVNASTSSAGSKSGPVTDHHSVSIPMNASISSSAVSNTGCNNRRDANDGHFVLNASTSSAGSKSGRVNDHHSVSIPLNASGLSSAGSNTGCNNRRDSNNRHFLLNTSISSAGNRRDPDGLANLTKPFDTTDVVQSQESVFSVCSELSTQNIMAKMDKRVVFHKCSNLTINFK